MNSPPRPDSGVILDFTDDNSGREANTPDTGLDSYCRSENHSLNSEGVKYLPGNADLASSNQIPSSDANGSSAGEGDATLTLADVAEWALDLQRRKEHGNKSERSLSVQLNNRPSISATTKWKSSTALLRPSTKLSEDNADLAVVMSNSRAKTPSYTNKDGVQLRGDKGKARQKSAGSHSRGTTPTTVSHEWKKSFVVPYSPRKKPTKLLRKSIEPPRIGLLDPDPLAEKDKERSRASSAAPTTSNNYIFHHRLRSEQRERRSYYKPKSQHVEIHYESCLPTDQWLEMKPKKFTRNHKHGNHFELRKLQKEETNPNVKPSKKEAFIWENPYQIWLMEKTHAD